MMTNTSISSCSLIRSLHVKPSHRFQSFFFNPICHLGFQSNPNLQCFSTIKKSESKITKRDFSVYSSAEPGPPLPSGSSPNSWRTWILGFVVTIIIPFVSHKWGPMLKWTKGIEKAVETVEEIVDAIENVAEEVDKVTEDISDDLPEGGKFRKAVDFVEDLAEKIYKDAHSAGDFIDKVQEMEDKVESLIEPDNDQADKAVKEAADEEVDKKQN